MRKNLKYGDIVMRKINPKWGGDDNYAAIYLVTNPNANIDGDVGFSAIVLHTFVKDQHWYAGQKHQIPYDHYDPKTLTAIW